MEFALFLLGIGAVGLIAVKGALIMLSFLREALGFVFNAVDTTEADWTMDSKGHERPNVLAYSEDTEENMLRFLSDKHNF